MGGTAVPTGTIDPTFGAEFLLERDAVPLHLWRRGTENAPTLVLTHGAGMNHLMFEPQIAALDRHDVITWDVRGHGASRPIGKAPLTADVIVQDLLALLDACEVEQAVLVGQSMGGNLSQAVVYTTPKRASGLVVIDSARNTQPRKLSERLMVPITGPSMYLWPYGNLKKISVSSSADSTSGREYMQAALAAMPKRDFVRATVAATQRLRPDPTYRVPTSLLLLCGEHDKLGSIAEDFEAWRKDEPDAAAFQVPAASHLSNIDNPTFVNRAIDDFLQSRQL
jgi:3-oxoadipate enol-lactonase